MSLTDLGNLGEFVGSIAVVVSLFYLAFQIRQNTRFVRASAHHAFVESSNSIAFRFAEVDAAQIILKGGGAYDDLTPEESFRFAMLMRAAFGFYEEAYHEFREGLLDRDVWESRTQTLTGAIAEPGIAHWWTDNCHLFTANFRDAVDKLLAAQQGAAGFERATQALWLAAERPVR